MGKKLHVAHDEVLPYGQKILHHVADDLLHGARMEDVAAEREKKHDEGEEREDRVGGDAEGVGVDFGARHVAGERDDLFAQAVGDDGGDGLDGGWRQLRLLGCGRFGLIGNG